MSKRLKWPMHLVVVPCPRSHLHRVAVCPWKLRCCVKHLFLPLPPGEENRSYSRAVWFRFYFIWFFSSSSSSPNVYSNYTEMAADLYIVFGSSSTERLGGATDLVSWSPLLCKLIKGRKGVVNVYRTLNSLWTLANTGVKKRELK